VRSHVRRALDEGVTAKEITHVGVLALTTIGFPHMIASLAWIDEVVARRD
jgi:alkylhydroperoxidase/carboxymuconolactone decarboxylase family protein YurZ